MNEQNEHYMNENLDFEKRVGDLLIRLTLDEKISLLTRYTTNSAKPIKRLGIPEFKMTDGPHGANAKSQDGYRAIYFPSAICLSASWNPKLAFEYGQALGEEVRKVGSHAILAPAINIHRTPLCGRNFEYFTEDPYLNSKMVVPLVKGVQSKRVAACVKHFLCNNSEFRRQFSNSIVSERALEEIYYPGFKVAVSEGQAWMVMGSYNKINGQQIYEQKPILTEKLRDEWGFKGFVVSDWSATHSMKDPAACINAGFTLEMPKIYVYDPESVKDSLKKGEFTIETLDENIRRFLRVLFYVGLFDSEEKIPKISSTAIDRLKLARRIAEEGAVLLKNDNNLLPLDLTKIKKICVAGPMADYKPFIKTIGGSSAVNPEFLITPLYAFKKKLKNKVEFVKKPKEADVVVFVTGITQWFYGDNEGSDKRKIELSKRKVKKILNVASENPNVVVVLYNGGPLAMSRWIDQVPAVLEVWQPHQIGGLAIANILLGLANPSGKLPTTFPQKLSDSPAHKSKRTYPSFKYSYFDMLCHEHLFVHPKRGRWAKPIDIYYNEGIFVGYRYFDENDIEPLFPFGFGLSYTTFKYSNLKKSKSEVSGDENFSVSVDITNAGTRTGAEIVQLYIQDVECSVKRPPKELKGFKKVFLKPGEVTTAKMELDKSALSFWDEKSNGWKAEKGKFNILVGSSSRDVKLQAEIEYQS
jgi:beta-glucosidase